MTGTGAVAVGPGMLSGAQSPRRPAFALTPLADIMFQLLIFFMLSTSLAPYALLSLGGGTPAEAAAQPEAAAPPGAPTVWHLGRGQVRSGTVWIDLPDLPQALATLAGQGVAEVLLFVTDTASLQDMVTVLEAAQGAGLPALRLMGR